MLMDADGHLRDPGACLMALRVRVFVPEAM